MVQIVWFVNPRHNPISTTSHIPHIIYRLARQIFLPRRARPRASGGRRSPGGCEIAVTLVLIVECTDRNNINVAALKTGGQKKDKLYTVLQLFPTVHLPTKLP